MAQRCQPAGAMSAPPSPPRPRASIRKLAVEEEKMVSTEKTYSIDCVVSIGGSGNGLPLMSGYLVEDVTIIKPSSSSKTSLYIYI